MVNLTTAKVNLENNYYYKNNRYRQIYARIYLITPLHQIAVVPEQLIL